MSRNRQLWYKTHSLLTKLILSRWVANVLIVEMGILSKRETAYLSVLDVTPHITWVAGSIFTAGVRARYVLTSLKSTTMW